MRRRAVLRLGLAIAASGDVGGNAAAASAEHTVLVVGDSLSAEYGLERNTGWVSLLAERIAQAKLSYIVQNASISGETTSGGRARLPDLLARYRPALVVIELGGNDALRGLPLAQMSANLQAMVSACRAATARVLLIGMRIPPNYGRAYAEGFGALYGELARANQAALVPFLMDRFADRIDLFQADRIHPTAAAQALMLDTVWPYLQPMLVPGKP